MEPRLWEAGKLPRASNAVVTLIKGRTRFLRAKILGDLNSTCHCC